MQHLILLVLMFSFTAGFVTVVMAELYRRRYPMRTFSGIRNAVFAFNLLTFCNLIYIYQRLNLGPSLSVGQQEILLQITQLIGTILVFIYVFFLIVLFFGLLQSPVSKRFRRCYWIVAAIIFGAQLIGEATGLHIFRVRFNDLVNLIIDVGSMAFLVGISAFALFRTHKINIPKQRKISTNIAAFYALLFFLFLIFWITLLSDTVPRNFSALTISFLFLTFNLAPLFYMNPLFKLYLVADISADQGAILKSLDLKYGITNREMEVIKLIAKGNTNKEISDILYIALQTVKDHNRRIFRKLGVRNRVQLVNLIRNIQKTNLTSHSSSM
jgi:DNA-binding CsgD family transcriptional regulator